MTVHIRAAAAVDADRMAMITVQANAEYVGVYNLSGAADTAAEVARDLSRGVGWLAELDGHPAGAVRCRLLEDRQTGYIKRLAVVPANRRRGVGRALMAAAERHLWDAGARRITLSTVAANTGVTDFYTGLGYRATGDTPVPHRGFDSRGWEKVRSPGA